MTAPATAANPRQTMFIIWASLLTSHLMYLAVLILAPHQQRSDTALVLPLSAVAIALGLATLGLFFKSLGDEQLAAWVQQAKQQGKDRAEAEQSVLQRVTTISLLCWALAEAVTLMGLMLAFMGQIPLQRFYFFLGGGIALMLVCRPRLPAVEQAVSSTYGGPRQ